MKKVILIIIVIIFSFALGIILYTINKPSPPSLSQQEISPPIKNIIIPKKEFEEISEGEYLDEKSFDGPLLNPERKEPVTEIISGPGSFNSVKASRSQNTTGVGPTTEYVSGQGGGGTTKSTSNNSGGGPVIDEVTGY